jgi:molybdopterin-guanine dinucleotide biosynthesis protein A
MAAPAGPHQAKERAGSLAALVLAGGWARRLGGADKPGIAIAGQPMVTAVAAAAAGAGAGQLVVVGPPRPGLAGDLAARGYTVAVEFITEQPPGAGPVPALRAGLQLVAAPWLFLLAADLPFLRDSHLRALLTAARERRASGAMLVDDQGRPQWLASCWRTADLAALASYQGSSLGGVLGPLRPVEVTVAPDQAPPWLDCDTPQDVAAARALGADARQRREADDEHTR